MIYELIPLLKKELENMLALDLYHENDNFYFWTDAEVDAMEAIKRVLEFNMKPDEYKAYITSLQPSKVTVTTVGNSNTITDHDNKSFKLSAAQIGKLNELSVLFHWVTRFTISTDSSSGIGETVRVKFGFLGDDDVTVDITDLDNW